MPTPNETESTPKNEYGLVVTRHLPCPLTDKRKLEMLDEVAVSVRERERLNDHLKSFTANTKKIIAGHEEKIKKITTDVHQGIEMKPVICTKTIDYVGGRITITRDDTGEVLEDRALEEEDMKP